MPYETLPFEVDTYAEAVRPAEKLRSEWLLRRLGLGKRKVASSDAIAKSHPALYKLGSVQPRVAELAFLAATATVIGDVTVGRDSSIWFGAILRGDNGPIRIGNCSNVQDGAIVHSHPDGEVTIGNLVSVGHQAILHGCVIRDRVLIGMQVCIMDGATISEDSIVAAGSLVTRDKHYPPGVLIQGSPARVVRTLNASDLQYIRRNALEYVDRGHRYSVDLVRS